MAEFKVARQQTSMAKFEEKVQDPLREIPQGRPIHGGDLRRPETVGRVRIRASLLCGFVDNVKS